ncbi:MAG: hypothetical protein HC865_10490 [Cyanobacteria bacterium RU_5_0]|nr:hypothetical protein [Cyanobacteria bacterium RU_5_0]
MANQAPLMELSDRDRISLTNQLVYARSLWVFSASTIRKQADYSQRTNHATRSAGFKNQGFRNRASSHRATRKELRLQMQRRLSDPLQIIYRTILERSCIPTAESEEPDPDNPG